MNRDAADDLLRSPIGLELLELLARRGVGRLQVQDLEALAARVQRGYSRYSGDYDDRLRSLRSKSGSLAQFAEWLVSEMPHWWAALDRRAQIWASPHGGSPDASELQVDLQRFGVEAPKPRRALWTSTFVAEVISPWLEHPERQIEGHRLWKLNVSLDARVAEIHSPADWWAFAMAYRDSAPGYSSNPQSDRSPAFSRIDPDWAKVAADWDGVHLSIGGYLTAEDVTFQRDGATTELRGWDIESTVWLRWVFRSAAQISPSESGP